MGGQVVLCAKAEGEAALPVENGLLSGECWIAGRKLCRSKRTPVRPDDVRLNFQRLDRSQRVSNSGTLWKIKSRVCGTRSDFWNAFRGDPGISIEIELVRRAVVGAKRIVVVDFPHDARRNADRFIMSTEMEGTFRNRRSAQYNIAAQ